MDHLSQDQVVFELLCRLGDRMDKIIGQHAKPFRSAADPHAASKLRLIRQIDQSLDELEALDGGINITTTSAVQRSPKEG